MSHEDERPLLAQRDVDAVSQLLKLSGRRPTPATARASGARATARAEWMRIVRRRRFRRRAFVVAAGIAIALGAVAWQRLFSPVTHNAAFAVATVRAVAGSPLVVERPPRDRLAGAADMTLTAGDRLETTDGRAALKLLNGTTVRMDRNTVGILHAADRMTLEQGVLYVDSGSAPAKPALQIETAIGIVRPRGTQFQVSLRTQTLIVSVREGTVAIERTVGRWEVHRGERLAVSRQGVPERQTIARSGAEWAWILPLAEPFVLEGARLTSFLDWVAREQGWRWRYEPAAPSARADIVILHGSVEGMTPEEALEAVLPTCALEFEIVGDSLIVRSLKVR